MADTHVEVEIVGLLAEIHVERRFRRPPGDGPAVDAELVLPVPAGAAVDQLTVTVGDRVLHTRVEEALRAVAEYGVAVNHGRAATLVRQAHDDVLVQRIANLLPGDEVVVAVDLVVPVGHDAGAWQLTVPLTVSPRFDDEVDLVSAIPSGDAPAELRGSVAVRVRAGTEIAWLEATTHPFDADLTGADGVLWVDDVPLDRDLELGWATYDAEPVASLLVGAGYGLVTVEAAPAGDECDFVNNRVEFD